MSITATAITSSCRFLRFRVQCSDDSSKQSRGFGSLNDPRNRKTKKVATSREDKGMELQQRKSTNRQSSSIPTQAPILSSGSDGRSTSKLTDVDFEERLQAVRRSALEQKKAEEQKEFGPIDYDAPVETEDKAIGLGTKIGVGVAVVVFGLVFAFGDFLPSGSPSEEAPVASKKISEKEKSALPPGDIIATKKKGFFDVAEARLRQFEETLSVSPKDPVALEGAAVTLTELGEYTRDASLLQDLAKEKPTDPDVFRLLGEVKYELKDYEGTASAYKISEKVSKNINFEFLRCLTNALLAAKKPDEAVQVLLDSRERLNAEKSNWVDVKADGNAEEDDPLKVDPIQVDLLLGKAYSDWGHVGDAVAVCDQLISKYPEDFRGYLAKGIILKENGSTVDAERMFIQARFFAPEKAKAFLDRYAR